MIVPDFILIEDTIIKFGYDPLNFKGQKDYKKTIIRTCFDCNNIYEQKFIYAVISFQKKQKCKYCSNKEKANKNKEEKSLKLKEKYRTGEFIHPMLNKTHTDEAKEKLRNHVINKSWEERLGYEKSISAKEKSKKSHTGEKNHFYGKKHTSESLKKMSESSKKVAKRGKESHFYGKIYHPKSIKYEINGLIIFFKSSWELKVANYLSSRNIIWEYEKKVFELILDGKETTYTPDFYIPETNTIIEVKGYWRDDAKEKYDLFIKKHTNNFKIELWNKEKLKSLNII